jgi:sugar lactone lactonase YvrE
MHARTLSLADPTVDRAPSIPLLKEGRVMLLFHRLRLTVIIVLILAMNGSLLRSANAQIFFAADVTTSTVRRYSRDRQELAPLRGGLGHPIALATDSIGNLYVSDIYSTEVHSATLRKFSPEGRDLGIIAEVAPWGQGATGMTVGPDGNLYVAFLVQNEVRRYTPTGQDLGLYFGSLTPTDLAFDPIGNLYVAEQRNHLIRKYSPTGQPLGVFANQASGILAPQGVAIDADGNVYVANQGLRNVLKFSSTGQSLGVFAENLSGPQSITFDEGGNVYVAERFSGNVLRYTSMGQPLGTFVFAGGPADITFGAVPEPGLLALLAGTGCFGAGLFLRRRRRQVRA